MKTKCIALFCACFLLLTAVDMLVPRGESDIYSNVIRLHILADDNSTEAQDLKLLVRDAILAECGTLFSESGDIIAAKETIQENIPLMESVANRVLAENGADYTAVAELGYEDYPTRVYESVTLPAGTYLSLRLNLGKGGGNNWWCILFPPLCTGAASDNEFNPVGVNKKDNGVFTNRKYIFRFKLLEIFG